MKVTFAEFMYQTGQASARHPEWREGQLFFNVLARYRPDLAEQVRGTALDPFYRDARIASFLDFVSKNWEA